MMRELFWTCAACVGTGRSYGPESDPEFAPPPACPACGGRGVVPVDRDALRARVRAACDASIWAGRAAEVATCADAVMVALEADE